MRRTSRCNGVGSSLVRASRRAMLPISLCMPACVTNARPRPLAIAVPAKTMLSRSPRLAGRSIGAGSFRTGSLSPVSAASATLSDAASMRRASAATASPSARSSTSPGTTPVAMIERAVPSRTTVAVGAAIALQGGYRLLRARLLEVTQDGVRDDVQLDDDDFERDAFRTVQKPRRERDGHRADEQVESAVAELSKEFSPGRHGRAQPRARSAQIVRAVRRRLRGSNPTGCRSGAILRRRARRRATALAASVRCSLRADPPPTRHFTANGTGPKNGRWATPERQSARLRGPQPCGPINSTRSVLASD